MTGRERVLAAFAHVEADRVPLDVAATAGSEIEAGARARLLEHLGRTPREDAGGLDELLGLLEPDLGRVQLGAGGGTTLWAGRAGPPGEAPGVGDLERVEWPDPGDPDRLDGLRERADRVRALGRAVVLDTELGLVDGCQRLRGLDGWLADLLAVPAFAEGLMEHVTRVCAGILRGALRALDGEVDAVVLYEDLAGQLRPLVSPELYRRRVRPFHAALVEVIHAESEARAVLHCDGAISELLGDLVEIGVDAVNPVQTSARGMDPRGLKRRFGTSLSFWGGYDDAWSLAFGRPEDVARSARRVLDALAPGGGLVLGPSHPIGAEIPPENVLALVEIARRYGVTSK